MSVQDAGSVPGVSHQSDAALPMDPDESLGALLSRITSDFGDLVSTQVELAKVEIKEEVAKAGKGAAMLSAGAAAALIAILLVSFAAAWGLAEVIEPGWAFLVVGAAWSAAAAVLLVAGRTRLADVKPVPQTRQTIKEDVQWAQQQKI